MRFDKYTPDQRYLGLSKIFLNNSAQDTTCLAESMSTQMFRDAGLPAARVTHAFVELNGRKLGLCVLIEAMNKDFLRQYFKNAKGNLYEAYLQDIDQQLDLDGGWQARGGARGGVARGEILHRGPGRERTSLSDHDDAGLDWCAGV